MKIGKTSANSTAGEPASSPASFRPERLTPAKNLPTDLIVAVTSFDEECCARRPYPGLIPDV